MAKDLFETENQQVAAINEFRNLISSSGWKLYLTVIDQNIEELTECILTGLGAGGEDLGEEEIKILRKELALWKVMRDTPSILIARFEKSPLKKDTSDPYFQIDSESDTG